MTTPSEIPTGGAPTPIAAGIATATALATGQKTGAPAAVRGEPGDPNRRREDGVAVLLGGVACGYAALFVTGQVLTLPAAIGAAVVLDALLLWWRRARPPGG